MILLGEMTQKYRLRQRDKTMRKESHNSQTVHGRKITFKLRGQTLARIVLKQLKKMGEAANLTFEAEQSCE